MVELYDFIVFLPDGDNTMLGKNGVNLSGGKQRLAIAKVLLRNCKIIIFDKDTNTLDNRTQKTIER